MVRIIPFRKFEKLWDAGSGDTFFHSFSLIFPADVGCIFMHKH